MNVRRGILAKWLFGSTTIKKENGAAAHRIQDPNMRIRLRADFYRIIEV